MPVIYTKASSCCVVELSVFVLICLVAGALYIITHIPRFEDMQPGYKYNAGMPRSWEERLEDLYSAENPSIYELNTGPSEKTSALPKAPEHHHVRQYDAMVTSEPYEGSNVEYTAPTKDYSQYDVDELGEFSESSMDIKPRYINISSYFEVTDTISGKGDEDEVGLGSTDHLRPEDISGDPESTEMSTSFYNKSVTGSSERFDNPYSLIGRRLKHRFKTAKITPIKKPSINKRTSIVIPSSINNNILKSTVYSRDNASRMPKSHSIDQSSFKIAFTKPIGIPLKRAYDCPVKSVREKVEEILHIRKVCVSSNEVFDTCKEASHYFPANASYDSDECNNQLHLSICHVITDKGISVTCNTAICLDELVYIQAFDPSYGVLSKTRSETRYKGPLEKLVVQKILESINNGFEYIILNCRSAAARQLIRQVIIVPEETVVLEAFDTPNIRKPNINILVLDSVSRQQFYRVLPKTVEQMRVVNRDTRKESTVFDYELFQSLAPFTFVNVQSFMAGKQDFKSIKDREIDFGTLFKPFKDSGYHITMQEDTCWYDSWGSILTSNKKRSHTLKRSWELKQKWKEIKKFHKKYSIDSSGLSHLSCEVLQMYGKSNMFNRGTFCLNGTPFSAFFLQYIQQRLKRQSGSSYAPHLTYTHLNIAHERTGLRLGTIDTYLANFVNEMASLQNTITFIWSDHGGKTTDYAMMSLAGRFEVYDSFLFIVTPRRIIDDLPRPFFINLVKNQWSLVSAQDLHFSMIFLQRYYNRAVTKSMIEDDTDKGIFSDKSDRKSCDSLPIRDYALCKCLKESQVLPYKENKHLITWMAEFALGSLNNELSFQYNSTHRTTKSKLACLRLVGKMVKDVLYMTSPTGNRVLFDIFTYGPKGRVEIFNVQLQEISNPRNLLKLFHWQRISIYQKYSYCRDSEISIELCVCDGKKRDFAKYFASFLRKKIFGVRTNVTRISNSCLYKFTRDHSRIVRVYEIGNFCRDRILTVEVNKVKAKGWKLSNQIPTVLTLGPLTTRFVVAGVHLQKRGNVFDISCKIL